MSLHHRFFSSPQEAYKAPPEKVLYVLALYVGTQSKHPDYLATVDVEPSSPTYAQIISRIPVPYVGDELHHFGWNACCSYQGNCTLGRRFLVAGGQRSNRIYVFDTLEERAPKLHKILEPEELREKVNLGAPHTVHCLSNGNIMISMLGDSDGNAPGGFLLLDEDFNICGKWGDSSMKEVDFNYDFWYQPRHNVMVSTEWAAPKTYYNGFDLADVKKGKYGRKIHFWNWKENILQQTIDLGEDGWIPLETRFLHEPNSCHGFVGAALSSNVFHFYKANDGWEAKKVIGVEPVEIESFPVPLPGLITDLLISMDDRFLYFSNWLHGDIRQYDITDPSHPVLKSQLWVGGLIGRTCEVAGKKLEGGPQMLQLSLDGKRLYVTNSLFSSWDNEFYPTMAKEGSYLIKVNCGEDGMKLDKNFFIDFGKEPWGAARAHEVRYPGGDCTSDIWC
eukprot:jgi/Galph1/3912/GphlegSOOS_G2546.1